MASNGAMEPPSSASSRRDRASQFRTALTRATTKSCRDIAAAVADQLGGNVDRTAFKQMFAARLAGECGAALDSILHDHHVLDKLRGLDAMEAGVPRDTAAVAWRPTGDAAKDLRAHVEHACHIHCDKVVERFGQLTDEVDALEKLLDELNAQQEQLCAAIADSVPPSAPVDRPTMFMDIDK